MNSVALEEIRDCECGDTGPTTDRLTVGAKLWFVECTRCWRHSATYPTEAEAIIGWNRMPEVEGLVLQETKFKDALLRMGEQFQQYAGIHASEGKFEQACTDAGLASLAYSLILDDQQSSFIQTRAAGSLNQAESQMTEERWQKALTHPQDFVVYSMGKLKATVTQVVSLDSQENFGDVKYLVTGRLLERSLSIFLQVTRNGQSIDTFASVQPK